MQTNNQSTSFQNPIKLEAQKSWVVNSNLVGNSGPRQRYLEYIAKTCNGVSQTVGHESSIDRFLKKMESRPKPDGFYRCTRVFLHGHTSKFTYLKSVTCGKEWCRDCGQIGSVSHNRRVSAIQPRMQALLDHSPVQYMVITIPSYLWEKFFSKDVLNEFRTYVRRKLKREGRGLAVMRWHWAGEDGKTWKPHLNILCKGGFMLAPELSRWKTEISEWYKKRFDLKKNPTVVINTGYTNDEKKLSHWIRYVFRATMTSYPNKKVQATIFRYRNTSIVGAKKNWPKVELTEEEKLAQALQGFELDEETGEVEKITWCRYWDPDAEKYRPSYIPVGMYEYGELEKIGSGFYRRKMLYHKSSFIEVIKIPDEPPKWKPDDHVLEKWYKFRDLPDHLFRSWRDYNLGPF